MTWFEDKLRAVGRLISLLLQLGACAYCAALAAFALCGVPASVPWGALLALLLTAAVLGWFCA